MFNHKSSGRIEGLIARAVMALAFGKPFTEVVEMLMVDGTPSHEAHNAVRAAEFINKDS